MPRETSPLESYRPQHGVFTLKKRFGSGYFGVVRLVILWYFRELSFPCPPRGLRQRPGLGQGV